jgi:ATP-dependent helicase/nuclease subunit B
MSTPALRFLLVPDAGAARRVRRRIAEQGARSGVIVGAWPELLEWARRAYLVPARDGDGAARFKNTLASFDQAFWAESFTVAPEETAQAVEGALRRVLSATEPQGEPAIAGLEELPARPQRHLADLLALATALGPDLPDDLALLRALLAAPGSDALFTLRVERVDGLPALSRWQLALVGKLNRDAAKHDPDPTLTAMLETTLADPSVPAGAQALATLQRQLFTPSATPAPLDPSVQWVGVRDFLQEAEVAAGMVQALLREDPEPQARDIGLLVPDSFEYATALEDAFRLGGLALSGLPVERWRRDLGAEAVFTSCTAGRSRRPRWRSRCACPRR